MSMSRENDAKLRTLSAFLKIYPSSRLDEEGLTIYLLMLADVSAAELSVAMQKIAQHHIAIVVEATGHEASIGQDAYLLDEGFAEKLLLITRKT